MSQKPTVEVGLELFTLSERQLDNLAAEFYGKVIGTKAANFCTLVSISFDGEHTRAFLHALNSFVREEAETT